MKSKILLTSQYGNFDYAERFSLESVFVLLEQELASRIDGVFLQDKSIRMIADKVRTLAVVLSEKFPEHKDILLKISQEFNVSDLLFDDRKEELEISFARFNPRTTNNKSLGVLDTHGVF